MTSANTRPTARLVATTAVLDVALILVFAVSGRQTHAASLSITGVLATAWPFLAALVIGWLLTRVWRAPLRLWPHGVCLWLITLTGGMALRLLSGDTAATAFVIVATLVLALFLLGHRALLRLLTARRR